MRASLWVCVLLFTVLAARPAIAQVVADTDCWQTQSGTMAALPALPADFFGLGSDPRPAELILVDGVPLTGPELANCACPGLAQTDIVWLDQHGDPVPAGSIHIVSQVPLHAPTPDTCIRRLVSATFPGGVGVPDQVSIELVELSLQSASPISVTGGGVPPLWNVFLTENGVQATGQMEFTATTLLPLPVGTVTVPNLPVDFQFRFEPVIGGAPVFMTGNVNMQNPNPQSPGSLGQFAVLAAPVPSVSEWGLLLMFLGMLAAGAWMWGRVAPRGAARDSR
ncbi:MAG: hypothetical protein GY725_22980 [bacterium]|nr:hypothetical protein [bacterium]